MTNHRPRRRVVIVNDREIDAAIGLLAEILYELHCLRSELRRSPHRPTPEPHAGKFKDDDIPF